MENRNPALDDKFARYLGMEAVSEREGYAKVKLTVKEEFINGAGFVNGGVTFSLADFAFALAANAGIDRGLGINASMNYIKAGLPGDELFAEVKLVSRSRKLGTYLGEVTNKAGAVLASFMATAYFK